MVQIVQIAENIDADCWEKCTNFQLQSNETS